MGPNFWGKQLSVISKKSVKEGNHCAPVHQPTKRPGFANSRRHWLLPPPSQILPLSSFRIDKRSTFLEKKRRGGVETETTMSTGEGPSSGRPRAPEIEENRNAKRCRNWIRARAGEMAAKREMPMSAGQGPSGGGVNPMPETRVLDWILSDSNEGQAAARRSMPARGQRSGRGACLTFASTSVW
jgi:hypothetical protein